MLNECLLTEEDKLRYKIKQLEKTISDFKIYDQERKVYYSKVLQENGELKSLVDEFSDTNRLVQRLENLRKENKKLNDKLIAYKVHFELTPSEYEEYRAIYKESKSADTINKMASNNTNLRKKNIELEKKVYNLSKELNVLRQRNVELNNKLLEIYTSKVKQEFNKPLIKEA
jgi:predicted RNase H-like nuclease (RuvC/YqgF family)